MNGASTTTRQAFDLGAKFVLQKPISPKNALRCFRQRWDLWNGSAAGIFAIPWKCRVTIVFEHGQEIKAATTNVSEGGMALSIAGKLPDSRIAKVVFTLPGLTFPMDPKSETAWADGTGRVGVRFLDMSKGSKEQLEKWMSQQLVSA